MDNQETLVYDRVPRQSNKQGKLKDEQGHHRKNGINSGSGKYWTLRVVHKYFSRSYLFLDIQSVTTSTLFICYNWCTCLLKIDY